MQLRSHYSQQGGTYALLQECDANYLLILRLISPPLLVDMVKYYKDLDDHKANHVSSCKDHFLSI